MKHKSLSDIFFSFAGKTSAHGFSRLTSGSIQRRFIWALLVLSAASGFAYHLYEVVLRFQQSPVYTTIVEDTQAESFLFPDITICPTNFLNEFYSKTPIPSSFAIAGSPMGIKDMTETLSQVLKLVLNETEEHTNFYLGQQLALKQVAYRSQQFQSVQDSVLQCRYRGELCSYKNFTLYKDPLSFQCFTFSSQSRNRSHPFQADTELSLILFNRGSLFTSITDAVGIAEGFRAVLHEPGTLPDFTKSFDIPFNQKVTVTLDSTMFDTKRSDKRECKEDHATVTYTTDWSTDTPEYKQFTGSHYDCLIRLRQLYFLNICMCLADDTPIPSDLFTKAQVCHSMLEKTFFRKVKSVLLLGDLIQADSGLYYPIRDFIFKDNWNTFSEIKNRFYCFNDMKKNLTQNGFAEASNCLETCRYTKYSIKTASTDWPNTNIDRQSAIATILQDHIKLLESTNITIPASLTDLKNHFLVTTSTLYKNFEARIKNMATLEIKQGSSFVIQENGAYPLKNLFSDIGGILGLWIGCSAITICEFLEFGLQLTVGASTCKKKSKSKDQVDPTGSVQEAFQIQTIKL